MKAWIFGCQFSNFERNSNSKLQDLQARNSNLLFHPQIEGEREREREREREKGRERERKSMILYQISSLSLFCDIDRFSFRTFPWMFLSLLVTSGTSGTLRESFTVRLLHCFQLWRDLNLSRKGLTRKECHYALMSASFETPQCKCK